MDHINEIIESLGLESKLALEDIPSIDLYMDQVIQLFESKFSRIKRDDNEKILTKTMINNYAKGKLLFPIKNKKYSKEHLILISLIYHLKGALSISDIKVTLEEVNERAESGGAKLDDFYNGYLRMITQNASRFNESFRMQAQEAHEEAAGLEEDTDVSSLETVLLIASLAQTSNLYRRAAEKLVDQLNEQHGKPRD